MSIDRAKIQEAAQKYVTKGQYDKAIVEYQKLVKSDPTDARSWQQIATYFQRLDKKKDAIDAYKRVSSLYAQQGFFDKAVAVQKLILGIDPMYLDAHLTLVDLHQRLGLVRNAVAGLEQIAALHAKNGETVRALAMLEKMVEMEPDSVPSRIKYAEALSKAERANEAAIAFEGGAKLLKQQGRMDDYIKVSERLLFHRPEDHELSRELAKLYLERNDAKRALAKLQVVFKAQPKDVQTLEMLAAAFHNLGQLPKTISVYKELARIHADAKRVDLQKKILQRVLELDPGDHEAKQELALLANTRPPDALKKLTGMNLPAAAVVSARAGAAPAKPEAKRPDPAPSAPKVAPPRPPSEFANAGRTPPRPEPPRSVASPPVRAPVAAASPVKAADPMDADIVMVDDDNDLEMESLEQSVVNKPVAAAIREVHEVREIRAQGQQARPVVEERTVFEPQRSPQAFGTSMTAEAERTVFGESAIPAVLGGDVREEEPLSVRVAKLLSECDVFARYGLTHKIVDQLRTILTLDPLHRDARLRLIDLLESKGDADGAVLELEVLLEQTEGRAEARNYAERILTLDPSHAAAKRVLGSGAAANVPAPNAGLSAEEAVFFVDSEPPMAREKSQPKMRAASPSRQHRTDDSVPSIEMLGASLSPTSAGARSGPTPQAGGSMPKHTAMLLGEDIPDVFGIGVGAKSNPAANAQNPSTTSTKARAADPDTTPLPEILRPPESEPAPSARISAPPILEDSLPPAAAQFASASQFDAYPALAEERQSALDIPIAPDEFELGAVHSDPQPVAAERARKSVVPSDIEDVLDEVDFYLAQGLLAEARVMLEDALRNAPDHPLLLDKLSELPDLPPRAAASPSAETAALLDRPLEDDDFAAQDLRAESTALADFGSMAAELGATSAGEADDRTFDLAEKLADEFDAVDMEATSMGAAELDVEQVFAQFKKGVREQVGLEDSETHFDLGIAYREMDLLTDAIAEFQLCLNNPQKACAAYSMIGLCHMARGDYSEAITNFKKGLYIESRTELEEISLYYDLGTAYEKIGDIKEAIFYLEKVKKRDASFRDVTEKLATLMLPQAVPPAPKPQEDDIDAAFDDLFKS